MLYLYCRALISSIRTLLVNFGRSFSFRSTAISYTDFVSLIPPDKDVVSGGTSAIKGALDKYYIILQLSPKSWDFILLEVLAWVMTACWILHSSLIYFWRNMHISSIFYFSKSTSINIQYSSLWDTLKMMLFIKYIIKWKHFSRISWKFRNRFYSKLSI